MTEPSGIPFTVGTRRGVSLRTALLVIGVGTLVYVAAMGLAIASSVVPAAEDVSRRGRIAVTDYEGRSKLASRLDDVMTDLWRLLRLARVHQAPESELRQQHDAIEQLMQAAASTMPITRAPSMPTSMRQQLGRADSAAVLLSSVMLNAIGAMQSGDVLRAEHLMQHADSLDTPLNDALTGITTTTLRDVNLAETALATRTRRLAFVVLGWLVVGVLMLPVLVWFLQRRLYGPLRSLQRGLTRIERGDLDVTLSTPYDDEIGRLEQHFNRMTGILRDRRVEDARQALNQTAERTRKIFDSALDAVIVFDTNGLIQEWSPQAELTFGWTRDAALGLSLIDVIIPQSHRDNALAGLKRVVSLSRANVDVSSGDRRLELNAHRRDGTPLIVEIAIAPLDNAGAIEYAAFMRDITEQKRLSDELRQAQKMEAVGQLAGGVAHDFNNLLTGIIGYADLLQHDARASDEMREDAASIRSTALRGADLARSLLTLARRSQHREEPVDMHVVTREVADLVRRTFDRRIDIAIDLAAPNACVIGDHSLLGNALLNLALNARDAMPDGGTLTMTTRRAIVDRNFLDRHLSTSDTHDFVAVEVRDTGAGMSAETQARVFEPFFTTKEPGKGTGLGLATVYGTLRAHGGIVAVDSALGVGTRFTLYLPAQPDAASASPRAAAPLLRGKGNILLVDDEEVLRNVATRMLTRLGYHVECANDGHAAVQRVAKEDHGVDLVILDGNMPRLSGLEAAQMIHARHPQLPLIFASGYFDPSVMESPERYGFQQVVVEPYTLDDLSRVVAHCLGFERNGEQRRA